MDYQFCYYNTESCLQWSCIVTFKDKYEYNLFVSFLKLVNIKFSHLKFSLNEIKKIG